MEKDGEQRVKDLQDKIKNAKSLKEQQLKEATKHLDQCKKQADQIRTKWDTMKQVCTHNPLLNSAEISRKRV